MPGSQGDLDGPLERPGLRPSAPKDLARAVADFHWQAAGRGRRHMCVARSQGDLDAAAGAAWNLDQDQYNHQPSLAIAQIFAGRGPPTGRGYESIGPDGS